MHELFRHPEQFLQEMQIVPCPRLGLTRMRLMDPITDPWTPRDAGTPPTTIPVLAPSERPMPGSQQALAGCF